MRRRGPSRRGSRQGASRSRSKRRGPPWWGAQRQARSAEGHATGTSAEGWGPQEMDGYQAETNSNAPSLYAQSKGPNGWPMKTGVGCCNPRISNRASPTGSRWPTARVWRQELKISVSLRILFAPPAFLSARAQGQERATRKGAAPLVDRRTWPPRGPLRRPLAARGYHRRATFVPSWRAERQHSIDRYSPFRARQAWYLSRRCRPFRNPSSCLCFAVRRWRAGCCTTGCLPRAGEGKSIL